MAAIEVTTQAQLDKALKSLKPGEYVACLGGSKSSPLVVQGSSRVEARESSHVVAQGSSHVVAQGSSHVEAWGSSHVVAWGSSHVEASKYVSVHKQPSHRGKINGGVIIDVPDVFAMSAAEWCDYYGVTVSRGFALLYKALDNDLSTPHARRRNLVYTVGAKVTAPDWDSRQEYGNGLHACPSPAIALPYNPEATRFVQVKAKLAELVILGDKVKCSSLRVVAEVDRYGEPIAKAVAA